MEIIILFSFFFPYAFDVVRNFYLFHKVSSHIKYSIDEYIYIYYFSDIVCQYIYLLSNNLVYISWVIVWMPFAK